MKKEILMEAITRIRTEWLEEFVRTEQAAEQKARQNSRRTVLLKRWMTVAMNTAAMAAVVLAAIWLFNQSQKLPGVSGGGVGTDDLYPIYFESEADWVDYEAALEKMAAERIAQNAEWVLKDYDPEYDSALWLDYELSGYFPWTQWDLLAIHHLRQLRAVHPARMPRYNGEPFIRSVRWRVEGEMKLFWAQMASGDFKQQLGRTVEINFTYLEPEAYLHPGLKADASTPVRKIVDEFRLTSLYRCRKVRIRLGDRTADALTTTRSFNGAERQVYYFVYDDILVHIEAPCDADELEAWMTGLTFQ